MDFTQINLWAVLAAAVSSFLVGGLWYSPLMFGKAWMQAAGLDEERLAKANQARTFGLSLLLCLLSAAVFAVFLGPNPGLGFAIGVGVVAGLCWVASSFGINYLFEQRPLKLFAINGGYHTVQFALYGLILGVWQ